ncbi:hypothetical protein ASG29_00260 [Sphingomonas sp. Leaf412]|uniref:hypothetical protein n=1 Tax=Sphingomonas sp. Leaf412 TaxID=1736370 RepID=UPI0006FF96F4|nr:hypothetical protein [Sphingomonas sp. Leaf412]KQT34645.1 hypothetical protein ASG29_00260 [Sphingomonas sp. Leaf412]
MTIRFLPLLLSCVAPCLVSAQDPRSLDGVETAQMLYHERIVIRIPRVRPVPPAAMSSAGARTLSAPPSAATPVWIEKRAADCVPVTALTGASIDRSGDVDLVVADGRRLRAKLDDDCPTLDFYSGFYLKRTADGRICARRDSLRSRSGARCAITGFRTLTAKR